ncbi:MAG: MFS transporter, partial [Alicyclobacillaceae bacterium]|nr:MFS transporter [Alicyclobacillaceae bacterium]
KWSARKFIFTAMLVWGLFATLCGFVQNETQLIVLRFLLGVAEGGVWPAVLVLLASWFTVKERARANSFWMACLPVSAVLMAPLSGWLLSHFSWRTVFIVEGIPPFLWAIVWWFTIQDRPVEAAWMNAQEKERLLAQLEEEQKQVVQSKGYGAAFKNPVVWGLVIIYFFWMTGFYGYTLWAPSVVKEFSKDSTTMGLLTAIPFAFALIAMLVNSYWSDLRMNRVQHVVVPLLIAAVSMILGQYVQSSFMKMVLLTITAMGVYAPYGPLWAIPTAVIPASVVGAALGLQNAIGNLGGYFGPKLFGYLKDVTGHYEVGFFFLAFSIALAAIVTMILGRSIRKPDREERAARPAH